MASRLTQKDQKRVAEAKSAWDTGRLAEAIHLYERLAEKHRNVLAVLMPLAQGYVARGQTAKAQALLKRLAAGFRSNGEVMDWVGQTYYRYAQPAEALDAFEQALRCGLTTKQEVAVRLSMSMALERLNDLDAAAGHVAFLLEHAPELAYVHFMAGLIALRRGEAAEAEPLLRRAAGMAGASADLRARAWYELGRALDRQGKYDEAWEAIGNAKRIERPGTEAARAKSAWVAAMTDRLTHAVSDPAFSGFDSPPAPAPTDRPVLLVTGHPRSGTTLLEQMLDSHSCIVSADESSSLLQQVFGPIAGAGEQEHTRPQLLFNQVPDPNARAACTNYIKQLEKITADTDPSHWLIDKNPEAVVMIPALQRVVPSAKLVVVLRDPRDVVLSCYVQHLTVNPVSVSYDTIENTAKKYARTMALWLAMRERLTIPWVEVRYEDVVTDSATEMRRVLGFMGLAFEAAVLRHDSHAREKVVVSPTYHAVTQPIYRGAVGRWKHYEEHLAPAFETLAPFIEAFGYEA